MKKLRRIFIMYMLFVFLTLNLSFVSFAGVKVTEQNLNEAFQKLVEVMSQAGNDSFQVKMENGTIDIISTDEKFSMNYELTNEPIFTTSIQVRNGMSYDEYEKETQKLLSLMYGYIAVANVQDVEIENALIYISLDLLGGAAGTSQKPGYMIVDGEISVTPSDDTLVIKKSEFGNHVMDVVNKTYKESATYTDSEKTYTWTTAKKDVTADSCTLTSTMTVNTNADFSNVNKGAGFIIDTDITEQTADYVVKLKVGQKFIIESDEFIHQRSISGGAVDNVDDYSTKEMIAVEPGVGKIRLKVGNNKTEKKIYIIVEENPSNEVLEPVILKIESTQNNSQPNNNTNTNTNNPTNTNTTSQVTTGGPTTENISTIPNAGYTKSKLIYVCYASLTLAIIGLYSFHKKCKKLN